jgi:hypothetical protein
LFPYGKQLRKLNVDKILSKVIGNYWILLRNRVIRTRVTNPNIKFMGNQLKY